jgi:hypothetical protein
LYIIIAVFFAVVLLRGAIKFFEGLRRQDREIQEHRRSLRAPGKAGAIQPVEVRPK